MIDNLPQNLQNLIFGYNFNCTVDNLPSNILIINFINNVNGISCVFNKELNCLPNSVCEIKLPANYNQEIKQIPSGLKKIVCSSKYKFIDKFNNINIEFIN